MLKTVSSLLALSYTWQSNAKLKPSQFLPGHATAISIKIFTVETVARDIRISKYPA